MTVNDVKKRVAKIAATKGDDEVAHSMEDSLYEDVLQAIADNHPDPGGLAAEALKTRDIRFDRHCA